MPSGSKMRSRRNFDSGWLDTRAISTPNTSDPVWYIHRSPGWYINGNVASPRIQASGPGAVERYGPMATFCSCMAFRMGYLSGRRQDQADAHAEGQQVAHRDGPVRGHSVVEWSVESPQDLAGG